MGTFIWTIVLLGVIAWLIVHIVKQHKRHERKLRSRDEWLGAITRSLDGLQGVFEHINQNPDWAENFCSLLAREFDADGGAIYYHANGDSNNDVIRVLCTTGVCREWNLVVGDSTQTISLTDTNVSKPRVHFEPGVPSDFFWSRKPHLYNNDELTPWLPPVLDTPLRSGLVSPIRTDRGDSYLLLLRGEEKEPFVSQDQTRLGHCVTIAEAGFFTLRAEKERQRIEQSLHSAHEEGMLQISTGIIHNIGNGITVIQIALERLKSGELGSIAELAEFIDREIMPDMLKHLESGDLQYFLTEDPQGQEYLGALKTLIEQIPQILGENERDLEFVIDKFKNVTEIITLQQQFIGELGTENITSFNTIVTDVLKICQQPIDQNHIDLQTSLKATDRILVDTAMMRHIFLLLMKFAIDAAAQSRRSKGVLKVITRQGRLESREEDETTFVSLVISDNGSGKEILLDESDILADRQNVDEQTRDLFFIKRRVEKYGGVFELDCEFGIGTTVSIHIPSFDASKPSAPKQVASSEEADEVPEDTSPQP